MLDLRGRIDVQEFARSLVVIEDNRCQMVAL